MFLLFCTVFNYGKLRMAQVSKPIAHHGNDSPGGVEDADRGWVYSQVLDLAVSFPTSAELPEGPEFIAYCPSGRH